MKKTILIALLVGLTALYLVEVSAGQKRLLAQTRRAEQRVKVLQQQRRIQDSDFGGDVEVKISKSQRLRNEIQQLFQKHLQTMNDEELTAKKADLQKELGEHEAKEKLQQAEKLLQEILKTYPKSRAAKHAYRMMKTRKELNVFRDEEKAED